MTGLTTFEELATNYLLLFLINGSFLSAYILPIQ